MKKHLLPTRHSAFSLIELVVVIAIIAIIAGFIVPAATGVLRGSAITQASQILTDQISLARQLALSRNRAVEVRFYAYGDAESPGEDWTVQPSTTNPVPLLNPKAQFRAIQLFEILESGVAVRIDSSKLERLPVSVVIEPNVTFSSLIKTPAITPNTTSDPDLPRKVGKNYVYTSFRFLQDGSTNLSPTQAGGWFVTIRNLTDIPVANELKNAKGVPINFFTLQIDPVSGAIKGFRPTAA